MAISSFIHGSIYILPLIPSVFVAIFNLYHVLTNRALRSALNNHVIVLLLCCGLVESLIDIPLHIYYYRNGNLVAPYAFCLFWAFLSLSMYIAVFILTAWASIERHILVFYPNWLQTKMNRFYFHYFPLAVCILYPMIFYFVTLIALPCNNPVNYNYLWCGRYACVFRISWVALWDSIANYIIPAFTTVIFSVILFARVLYKRYRARGQIDWRNYKKMTAQLLPISILYIAVQLPPMVLYAAYSAGVPYSVASNYYSDGLYFTTWIALLTPFATVMSLPDLKTKCLNLLFWRRNRAVRPAMIEMTRNNVNRSGANGMTRTKLNHPPVMEMVSPKVNQPTEAEMTLSNDNQPTGVRITHTKLDHPPVMEMASPKVNQPTEAEMIPSNDNQPTEIGMTSANGNQPIPIAIVSSNVHQPTGAVMVHHYMNQPTAVLPDVQ